MNKSIPRALEAVLYKASEKGFSGSIGDFDDDLILTLVKDGKPVGSYEVKQRDNGYSVRYYKLHGESRNIIPFSVVNETSSRNVYDTILRDLLSDHALSKAI